MHILEHAQEGDGVSRDPAEAGPNNTMSSFKWETEEVNAIVVKEEALSAVEAGKRVLEFIKRRHVIEVLSAEDYSRLRGLQEYLTIVQEKKKDSIKTKKRSRSDNDSEKSADTEPERKKKRRRPRSDIT